MRQELSTPSRCGDPLRVIWVERMTGPQRRRVSDKAMELLKVRDCKAHDRLLVSDEAITLLRSIGIDMKQPCVNAEPTPRAATESVPSEKTQQDVRTL